MILRYALLLAISTALAPIINKYHIFKNVKIFSMHESDGQRVNFTYVGLFAEIVEIDIYLVSGTQQRTLYSRSIRYGSSEFNDNFIIIPFITEKEQVIFMNATTSAGGAGNAAISLSIIKNRQINPIETPLIYADNSYAIVDDFGRVQQFGESLEFINFHEVTESPSAHKLDLSALKIRYECDDGIRNLDKLPVKVYIVDENDYFDRLNFNQQKKAIELNAQLLMDGEYYHIALTDRLFVDRYSRMMSLESDVGFILTEELYFPVNYYLDMNYLSFSIEIPSLGLYGFSMNFRSQYYSHKTYVGSCDKATYCLSVDESNITEINANKIEVKL